MAPAGFRTDGIEYDAPRGDSSGRVGRVIVAAVTGAANGKYVTKANTLLFLTSQGLVFRINDNREKEFSFSIISSTPAQPKERWLDGLYIDGRDQWITDESSNGVRVALVAPKTTDVLRIRPNALNARLLLNPAVATRVRAAYYSAATLLIRATAIELDIDSEELEIASIHGGDIKDPSALGEIMLADHLANGAGFTEWLANNWNEILNGILDRTGRFASKALPCRCQSGCYKCMLSFRNRPLHPLLDWRLGVDLLNAMRDQSYDCGASPSNTFFSIDNWKGRAADLRDGICEAFHSSGAQKVEGLALPAFSVDTGGAKSLYVLSHPLWSNSAVGNVVGPISGYGVIRSMNTFDLSRRMAWCWRNRNEDHFPLMYAGSVTSSAAPTGNQQLLSIPGNTPRFVTNVSPRGMPARLSPKFKCVGATDTLSTARYYLVRNSEGEYIVGRVMATSNDVSSFRVMPVNHWDRVEPFSIDRSQVTAEVEREGS
ncbi:MAG: hypothetical protein JW384_03103 [Nitrosomonadaceae bacterium]|nr:hypothetical protein [Nitrosomonadaceae bacterium]